MYSEFFNEVLALARKNGYTALDVTVSWGNNPTERMTWNAPVAEMLSVQEV